MPENELPDNVQEAILDAELTPDDKLVAEEQAQDELEPNESIINDVGKTEEPETEEQPEEGPAVSDPGSRGTSSRLPSYSSNRPLQRNQDRKLPKSRNCSSMNTWTKGLQGTSKSSKSRYSS